MTEAGKPYDSAAEALLARLGELGVDYLFGNAGTDFPPIIEALSGADRKGRAMPVPITVPHENLAMAMAYGAIVGTGRPQAVMVHVSVGTANAMCGLLNAARENLPLLLFAGRTPISEGDAFGARSVFIHWGQEMFDQAGMLREIVKWDYELRTPDQVAAVADRAWATAMSEPRGPVYVSLPREVLAAAPSAPLKGPLGDTGALRPPAPDPDAVEQLADWLAAAEAPLVITASYGRDAGDVERLAALAERFAIPVVGHRPRRMFLPTTHPMHMGLEPAPLVESADLVLVVDCDVPWVPSLHKLNPAAKVVHIGWDPLFGRYPMRSFPCHLAITGPAAAVFDGLAEALAARPAADGEAIEARRGRLATMKAESRERARQAAAKAGKGSAISAAWVAHCVDAVKTPEQTILSETSFPLGLIDFEAPGGHFGISPAGGLGWALGAGLGLKLTRPDLRVISVIGDGSYMFGNPTPAHFVSAAHDLPWLTIILNNQRWDSVQRATMAMYPDGAAAKSNRPPLTWLEPSPRYERVVEASDGFGEMVERPADLPGALERAFHAVEVERRQAVLNVICAA